MRRIGAALALTTLAALALTAVALAKEGGVSMSSTPAGLGPGDPWNLGIQVFPEPGAAPPRVTIQRSDTAEFTRTYRTEPLGGAPDTFVTTIRFPEAGEWSYIVRYGGGTYEFDPVVIETPVPAPASGSQGVDPQPVPAVSDDGGFPLWPVVGGLLAAALLAGTGLAWLRGRRLPPWPAAPSSARTASRGR